MGEKRPPAVRHHLSSDETALRRLGVEATQAAHKATVLGYILQDKHGVFVTLIPGREAEISAYLYDIDWTKLFAAGMNIG